MRNIYLTLITTVLLVIMDFILRRDLISESFADYFFIVTMLICLLFFARVFISLIPIRAIKYTAAFVSTIIFSFIYWLQSAVYTVYFQFINAVDIGLVMGNLNYWQKGADKLVSVINLPWLLLYLVIFSFLFFYQKQSKPKATPVFNRQNLIILGTIGLLTGISLFNIKQQQLYYLATPVLSLAHETRRFALEKDRFIKQIKADAELDYYPREIDRLAEFNRRGDFNVVLLLLESLRFDHMSLYGYARDTTPFQASRFADAYHFTNAVSNTTSTDTSAELIFTGKDLTNDDIHQTSLLWSYVKQAGLNSFYTGSHWLQWNGWFGRAFLSEQVDSIQAPLAVDASLTGYDMITARKFKSTLSEFMAKPAPFFSVVHFAGTHYPYVSPPDYQRWLPASDRFNPGNVQQLINKYDNAILYNDAAIENVINTLDQNNLSDNTIIVVTADHAEAMYEHRQFFHGKVFWQEGIHVPLYIHIPEKLKSLFTAEELSNLTNNRSKFVSIVDVFPTILDLYNIPAGKNLDGFSLLKPYPEKLIRIYMTPDEYAIINSFSGEKYLIDNNQRKLRQTNLRLDPKEKNFSEVKMNQRVQIKHMIKLIESDRLAEIMATDS